MKIVQDVFDAFKVRLKDIYEMREIEAITAMVLETKTVMSRTQLKAFPDTELAETAIIKIQTVLQRLITGEPVQYALGGTDFFNLYFVVTPDVLIPRPETEELVQWIIGSLKNKRPATKTILDIGTGSGCIAISLQKNLPDAVVYGIDISSDALDVAETNNAVNETHVRFLEADILMPDIILQMPKLDVIVSNPPYVTDTDKQQMHRNVIDFEPHTALFVPENDPLLFYDAIANFAKKNLNESGQLFFEINENFGEEMVELLKSKGFKNIELKQDMSGRDRMMRATL